MIEYRIWHISNPPNKGFKRAVGSPAEAVPLLLLIAEKEISSPEDCMVV